MHEVREGTSLVATVLNEAESLRAFLGGLAAQTLHPAEIMVVDGGSTDATVRLLSEWEPDCGCRARVIIAPGAGISAGRNLAIGQATYEDIVVSDAGTAPRRDWFERLTAPWQSTPGVVVAGFFEPTGQGFWSRTIAAVTTPTRAEIDPVSFLPSSRCVAFPREAWRSAGGYPEWLDYCEDVVFDLELRRVKGPFVFAPDAIVAWAGRPNLRAFAKQYYRYARGDGKADLFVRRHVARYGAYLFAVIALRTSPWLFAAGALGFLAYLRMPWRRVWARRAQFSTGYLAAALAAAPVVVIVGDAAKMAGYPAGLVWRRRMRGTR